MTRRPQENEKDGCIWKIHCVTAFKESLKAAQKYRVSELSSLARCVVYIYIHIKMHSVSERAFSTPSTLLPRPHSAPPNKRFSTKEILPGL